jgi:hypothetical protein
MKRYRLHWPDDLTTTYRNSVVEDPRPRDIICYELNYFSVEGRIHGINIWEGENDEIPKYVFYQMSLFCEYLGEV